MKIRHFYAALTALAVTLGAEAVADEIYKWTDADGSIHYEDRPSGNPTEERLTVVFTRTNNASVNKRTQARLDAQDARAESDALAADDARMAAELKAETDHRAKLCESNRNKLQTMLQSARLYRLDESGERVYLDDSQREAARKRTEDAIQEYCNS